MQAQCCMTAKDIRAGSFQTCLRISKQQKPYVQLDITKELRMACSLSAWLRISKQVPLAVKCSRALGGCCCFLAPAQHSSKGIKAPGLQHSRVI